MPSKSQMAFALLFVSHTCNQQSEAANSRIRIQLIQEPTTILLCKDTGETPRLILQRLYVLNLYNQYISRFSIFDLKGSAEVVDLGQVNILDVVCVVGVFDLAAGPVNAFDLDYFAVCDLACKRDCSQGLVTDRVRGERIRNTVRVPAILERVSVKITEGSGFEHTREVEVGKRHPSPSQLWQRI